MGLIIAQYLHYMSIILNDAFQLGETIYVNTRVVIVIILIVFWSSGFPQHKPEF